jgi:hypothetical protein
MNMQWVKRLLEPGGRGGEGSQGIIVLPHSLSEGSEERSRENSAEAEDLSSVDPEERAWVEWFNALPQSHKDLVETSLHHGICVQPDNFERLLPRLRSL